MEKGKQGSRGESRVKKDVAKNVKRSTGAKMKATVGAVDPERRRIPKEAAKVKLETKHTRPKTCST